MKMSGVLSKLLCLPVQFPLVRGMISYAVIWPSCSLVQEYFEHGTKLENANWERAARFGIFGTFFMAPVFYGWLKYSSFLFTRKDLATAITRAAVEQISYSPLAMAYFFFGMSLLEGKTLSVSMNEVREKFWPTYKIGVVFWPVAQTINFYFISEKNRIIFVSIASFVWTVYLAHMKGMKQKTIVMDSQSIPVGTVSESLENVIDNMPEKKPVVIVDINTGLPDEMPAIEIEGDIDTGEKKPPLVIEPRLVSDIMPASGHVPRIIVKTRSAQIRDNIAAEPHIGSVSDSAANKKTD